jgi:hypothetical protein
MSALTKAQAKKVKQDLNALCEEWAEAGAAAKGRRPWMDYLRDDVELPLLGYGSERAAFLFEVEGQEPRVLKVPTAPGDTTQQYFEWDCYSKADEPDEHPAALALPVIWDWGPGDYICWLEVEYLRTLTPEEFQERALVDFRQFAAALRNLRHGERLSIGRQGYRPFLDAVADVVARCELDTHDLGHLEHWGLGEKGRIKLRDFGLRERNPKRRARMAPSSAPDRLKRKLMR